MASYYQFRPRCSQLLNSLLVCLYFSVSMGDKVMTCQRNDSNHRTTNFPQICLELNSSDWDGAEVKCQAKGGHLASILTDEEEKRVEDQVNIAIRHYGNNSICGLHRQWWIGLKKEQEQKTFSWTDNSTFDYHNIKNMSSGVEPCVFMKFRPESMDLVWKTKPCTEKLCFVCKLGADTDSTSSSSAAVIGGVIAGVCITSLVVFVLLYIWCRRRKRQVSEQQLKDNRVPAESTAIHLSNLSYVGRCQLSATVKQSVDERTYDEIQTDSVERVGSSGYSYAYVSESTSGKGPSQTRGDSSGTLKVCTSKANGPATNPSPEADDTYWQIVESDEGGDDVYWAPADSVEKLYAQFHGTKFRRILRTEIHIHETIGSGEFGTVAKATWQGSGDGITVAVKMLNHSSDENKVRFLQEGAVMGQFKHRNIVALHGLILEGEPLILAVDFMENGDLNKYLHKLRETSNLACRLLRMAREIANGMRYLAHKAFIHRDLATRNVMLDGDWTCKIGDFGLSRDLAHNDYYVTQGGRIPLRWTAPEAVMYRKYSPSSDIWSYGIVLYELWTVGRRPYDESWSNNYVVEMLETGYRLPPPPGCSHVIYKLMIKCWHPDYHDRPDFDEIVRELDTRDDELLVNSPDVEPISGRLGGDIEDAAGLYEGLQTAYNGMEIAK